MKFREIKGMDCYSVESHNKMLSVSMLKATNSYNCNVYFISSVGYMDSAKGIFDSGASNTIISIKALYGDITDTQYKIIKNALESKGSTAKAFSSVKEKNDTPAMFCTLPAIKIGSIIIHNFPFYLMDNRERAIVLIGNDFLSSCDITQCKDSVLNIYNFDIQSMWKKMHGENPLNLLSVMID